MRVEVVLFRLSPVILVVVSVGVLVEEVASVDGLPAVARVKSVVVAEGVRCSVAPLKSHPRSVDVSSRGETKTA